MNAEQFAKHEQQQEERILSSYWASRIYTYFWIDADGNMRSKQRVMRNSAEELPPDWNFDGSSTGQASGENSEVVLKPRAKYFLHNAPSASPSSTRSRWHYLVLCDTWHRSKIIGSDGKISYSELTPAKNNNRDLAEQIFSIPTVKNERLWFGLEQEYFLKSINTTNKKHGEGVYCDYYENPGTFYCGVGAESVYIDEQNLVNAHRDACLNAGINISGTNAEVAPSQWEFQVGPCEGIDAADQLWAARYLLVKMACEYGYEVIFSPKLNTVPESESESESESDSECSTQDGMMHLGLKSRREDKLNINGSGCHTNFSTKTMRTCPTKTYTNSTNAGQTELVEKDPSAIKRRSNGVSNYIMNVIECLEKVHNEHMLVYGDGNEARMTGNCETASYDTFSYGVGDRGTSIRIPVDVFINGYGYIEDRRPAANADPYLVTSFIARTVAPATTNDVTSTEMTPTEFKEWESGVFMQAEKSDPNYRNRVAKMVEDVVNKRAAGAESEDARRAMDERFARAHKENNEDYEREQMLKYDSCASPFDVYQRPASSNISGNPSTSSDDDFDETKGDSRYVRSNGAVVKDDFDETKGESLWGHYNTVVKNGRRVLLDDGIPEQRQSYYNKIY